MKISKKFAIREVNTTTTGKKIDHIYNYDSAEEAADKIMEISFGDIGNEANMFADSKFDIERDEENWNKAYAEKQDEIRNSLIDGVSFDDGRGLKLSIEEITLVNYGAEGMLERVIEIDEHEIDGKFVTTDGGNVILIKMISDAVYCDNNIRVYEAINEREEIVLVASDNASIWLVGSEDDRKLNHDQFKLINRMSNVNWDDIEDSDLAYWVNDRREDAENFIEEEA